jgi:hypothetical protein
MASCVCVFSKRAYGVMTHAMLEMRLYGVVQVGVLLGRRDSQG